MAWRAVRVEVGPLGPSSRQARQVSSCPLRYLLDTLRATIPSPTTAQHNTAHIRQHEAALAPHHGDTAIDCSGCQGHGRSIRNSELETAASPTRRQILRTAHQSSSRLLRGSTLDGIGRSLRVSAVQSVPTRVGYASKELDQGR